ncbi:MAG: glutaminyl-peptide cyclotransferase [Gemmatimonadetes bacterium]|nr:glutaminyl-peptide cyclotransferase [Gemmatimonadota bacterium]MXX33314.1 glutaminyl-peptide cyclotransferase [Gemmatimonadota bacterium]MYD14224.1 glutaminyl-peptide cyclotransferase [Gemmatimonadota bacterium]MYI65253.1 glutaminyl-peptide cyclotransferase [Gemmatimonadota bacterium]
MKRTSRFRCGLIATWALIPATAGCGDAGVAELAFEVRRTVPHDPGAYTQGLLIHEGAFLESTGQYGSSDLRRVDIATGEVLQIHALSEDYFGEGIAVVDDRVIQLTWKAGLAFVYDAETFDSLATFEYDGEGWGLCYDGASLFMSDGSSTLFRRDPATFEVLEEIRVTRDGFSKRDINELECVGEHLYANVYMTNEIVRIDKITGEIIGELDALSLALSSNRPSDSGAVFNGIAWDEASGTFYVTGKLWPQMFEIAISGG